jgi:hypothetical protein
VFSNHIWDNDLDQYFSLETTGQSKAYSLAKIDSKTMEDWDKPW